MFVTYRLRWVPGRIPRHRDNLRSAQRRFPVHPANTHGIGMHYRRFALFGFREIIHSVFCEIQNEACSRAGRQDESIWQNNFRAITRQPDIHIRIGSHDILVAQTMTPGNVDQGILVACDDRRYRANNILPLGRQIINSRFAGTGCCDERSDDEKTLYH